MIETALSGNLGYKVAHERLGLAYAPQSTAIVQGWRRAKGLEYWNRSGVDRAPSFMLLNLCIVFLNRQLQKAICPMRVIQATVRLKRAESVGKIVIRVST